MAIEATKKFKVSNADDFVEVDKAHGVVVGEIAGEHLDLTSNKLAFQGVYLRALADLFDAAAKEFGA